MCVEELDVYFLRGKVGIDETTKGIIYKDVSLTPGLSSSLGTSSSETELPADNSRDNLTRLHDEVRSDDSVDDDYYEDEDDVDDDKEEQMKDEEKRSPDTQYDSPV